MGAVWSDERRFQRWLDVEIAAMAGWADLGVVPADAVAAVRSRASVDVARILEIESRTHHDVLAFTESVSEQVGPEARWFHYGLTSSDVVDTALALQLRDAGELLLARVDRAERAVLVRAEEHRHTPTIGRTHGVHAEPTTFGLKLLGWVTELRRDRDRLAAAFEGVRVGKLSGAVGTYANCDPRVEDFALSALGLEREDVATQVIPRDRHATLLAAIAITGSSLDRFATEIRHLQRTEVREALEPFAAGQKGSSAMPHKQNPIISERISGLARVLRANAQVGLENMPLWHERDISHSSAERVVLPDSTIGLDYMLDRFTWLIEGLVVDGERMMRNLEASHGLVFSGRALLALVESGLSARGRLRGDPAKRAAGLGRGTAAARPAGGRPRGGRVLDAGRARPGLRPRRLPAPCGRRVRPHHRAAGADPCLTTGHSPLTRHPARCASCTATATRS